MSHEEALRRIDEARRTKATTLSLSGCDIDALPSELGQLTQLEALDVRHNQLTSLPPELSTLTQLQTLDVSGNHLNSLPSELEQLTQLQTLDVINNQLTRLLPELGQLTQLHTLDISFNQFIRLPSALGQLTMWQGLDVSGNPLDIPTELVPKGGESLSRLLAYLRQCGEDGARRLNEAKVILVGEGTVGKTSLVKRLMRDTFILLEQKTEGIAIEHLPVKVDDEDVRLNIWDFGGQEIMHVTHQFFLTKRSVYLLVLNSRANEHDNRLDYWLKLIQSFAADAPIIVVGNKADQHPLDLDQRGLMLKYPQITAFVGTSCATGQGIDELRGQIVAQLAELKHIRDVLPASWWRVKQQLENWQRDYISHGRFQEMCEQHGIDDVFVQMVLLRLLNDLGTVLSYHDDPRLAETNVLNPEWVTNGVYTLLNHKPLLEQRSGILSTDALITVLSTYGSRYPRHKCHFITEMMEKFELCFPIDRDQWLLPDLLPKEEPDTGTWDDALYFVYRYPVLPGSIISRFIVRSQHAIVGDLRWRNGVVLASGDNQAIIKADPEDARIDIRINGDPANRRRFLSAIRHTFEQIHASLSGLRDEVQELVPLAGTQTLYPYKHLLRLEARGIKEHYLPDIDADISIQPLLDGYETTTERQARQVDNYEGAPLEHLQSLLEIKQGHLRTYELQRASIGDLHVPPFIVGELEK